MPSELSRIGEKAGDTSAGKNVEGVRGCPDLTAVSKLAGRCLKHAQKEADHELKFICFTPEFECGFWEGFMARAEELRG